MKIQQFIKYWYGYYWFVCTLVLIMAVTGYALHVKDRPLETQNISVLAGFVASYFGVIFFVQKQKLEQERFFKELFVSFNERYDKMREVLESVPRTGNLDKVHEIILQRYFNLCAEELLFYSMGRIPEIVWKSWRAGMDCYLNNALICSYAKREVSDVMYHGLATELELGSRCSDV